MTLYEIQFSSSDNADNAFVFELDHALQVHFDHASKAAHCHTFVIKLTMYLSQVAHAIATKLM